MSEVGLCCIMHLVIGEGSSTCQAGIDGCGNCRRCARASRAGYKTCSLLVSLFLRRDREVDSLVRVGGIPCWSLVLSQSDAVLHWSFHCNEGSAAECFCFFTAAVSSMLTYIC